MAIMHRICNDPHRPVDLVNEDIPADLAELIDQLLCKDSAKRPKDAQTVADTLTSLLHDKRSKTRFRKRKRKLMNPRWPLIAAGCFIAITAACIWWGVNQTPKPAPDDTGLSGIQIADNSQGFEPPQVFNDDRLGNPATPVQGYSRFNNAFATGSSPPVLSEPRFSDPPNTAYRFDEAVRKSANTGPQQALRSFDDALSNQTPTPIPLFADFKFDMELEELKMLLTELESRQ